MFKTVAYNMNAFFHHFINQTLIITASIFIIPVNTNKMILFYGLELQKPNNVFEMCSATVPLKATRAFRA